MAEMGKITVNTWNFRGKKQVIGPEKTANWQPNRKAKWCKMHVMLSRMSQKTNPQDCNLPLIASFNALFSLEGAGEAIVFCKIRKTYLTKKQELSKRLKDGLIEPKAGAMGMR